ncbi:hypothetical protein EG328_006140 [Venturia inaequalis]|uniref:Uncharacterized protein n=1 Tax=Venturia inaequalis TaxID=5025 RepID=A0A8H3UJW9_VENIN|nr:hypothetical protein EG328_006140 [Venturia inaequalis]
MLSLLRDCCIDVAVIPGGCTGLLQPLDVSINKAFKELLREIIDAEMDRIDAEEALEFLSTGIPKKASLSERRIMFTRVVGKAWQRLYRDKSELIAASFVHTGINRIQDEIKVKAELEEEWDDFELFDVSEEAVIADQFRGYFIPELKAMCRARGDITIGKKKRGELIQALVFSLRKQRGRTGEIPVIELVDNGDGGEV